MSNNSLQLSMPYIQGGQAQKHITHNEAIRTLDTITQLSVISQATAPNAGAVDGDRYIVAPGATGDFAGQDGNIAMMETGLWAFFAAKTGWVAHDQSTGGMVVFDGNDWTPTVGGANVTSTDRMGVNATADTTNRLAVSSDATLLTHSGNGHQLKLNKAADADTASLLFQTGWSGRAEMGTTGSDNFEIKVSADGSVFNTALSVDRATGAVSLPNTALSDVAFGNPDLVTRAYTISRAGGLVTNGTGYLGNAYNYPTSYVFDASQSPNLAGAVAKLGYNETPQEMGEFITVDPNRAYRLGVYIRQESAPGDWSSFAQEDRHRQYMGFRCYDADGLEIDSGHHARHYHSGTDSLTTLAQPLAPGDTVIHVADASGWNETKTSAQERGVVIFGYSDSRGRAYDFYSRIEGTDLFDLGDVDKTANTITLNAPLPASLGNPNDGGGVWPVGTRIANRGTGWNYKLCFFKDYVLDATDTWYAVESFIGGVDQSGKNDLYDFPPGTAMVRPIMMLNYSNRAGGWSTFPDTGAAQKVWVSGLSVDALPGAEISRASDGSCDVRALKGDPSDGSVSFVSTSQTIAEL